MITLRKAGARGAVKSDWLQSWHTFSFGRYYDPKHMGYRSLRVINEDIIASGQGFGTHPHDNMEILTYVLEGTLAHKDSMGNGTNIYPGEVQIMSAGTGITHSEFNPDADNPTHLLQIWILPKEQGLTPTYQQKRFEEKELQGAFKCVASPTGENGSVVINQDANVYVAKLEANQQASFKIGKNRGVWLHVARGEVLLEGAALKAGGAAAVENQESLSITAQSDAEVLLFDLA